MLCIEQRDPLTNKRFWSVPGGAVEAGETPAEAAGREAFEETGYRCVPLADTETVTRYPFRWRGQMIDCTTHWFAGTLLAVSPAGQPDEPDVTAVMWIPHNNLPGLLAPYPSIRDTVLAVVDKAGVEGR